MPAGRGLRRSVEASAARWALPPPQVRPDEVTYVSIGDGATGEGEFWEFSTRSAPSSSRSSASSKTTATRFRAPPNTTRPAAISRVCVESFPHLEVIRVDGTDLVQSYRAMREAVAYARARKGPALVHAKVMRPYSHSHSDDERNYKTAEERELEAGRDPITNLTVPAGGGAGDRAGARSDSQRGRRRSRRGRRPRVEGPAARSRNRGALGVFPDVDPTSDAFSTPPRRRATRSRWWRRSTGRCTTRWRAIPSWWCSARTSPMRAVRHHRKGPGKGGVFKATHGLQRAFGNKRVFNSPLAEANIVGRAIGMAVRGHEAGRRDSVLRLHLAGDDADSRRAVDAAVPVGQHLQGAGGHPRGDRRISARRRRVSQPVRREHFRALPRAAHCVSVDRRRCRGAAAHGDPLRRSGDVPRAQASVPPDVQQGRLSGPGLHDSVWPGRGAARRTRRRHRHVGRAGAAIARRRADGREERASASA